MTIKKDFSVFKSNHAQIAISMFGVGVMMLLMFPLLRLILPPLIEALIPVLKAVPTLGKFVAFILNNLLTENFWHYGVIIAQAILFAAIFDIAYLFLKSLNFLNLDRHNFVGLYFGLVLGFTFVFFESNFPFFKPIEEFSVDLRFRMSAEQQAVDLETVYQIAQSSGGAQVISPNPNAHPAINIIGINQDTVNKYQGFPFPWHYYANLTDALAGSGLNTIFFDIFFNDQIKNNYGLNEVAENLRQGKLNVVTPQMIQQNSKYLHESFKKSGNVVVDYGFETQAISKEELASPQWQARIAELDKYVITNIVKSDKEEKYIDWVDHPEPPIAEIGRVLKGMGYANIRKEETGVNRYIPMIIRWKNPTTGLTKYYPSIDLIIAARFYGIDLQKDVELKMGEYIKLKNIPEKQVTYGINDESTQRDIMAKPNSNREITIPINDQGQMPINFIGGPWSFQRNAFHDIADMPARTFSAENGDLFKNQILLVAMFYATGVAKDIHTSPFGDMAGIEHHANALNTILNQDFIFYASKWIDYLIYIIIGILIGFVVPRYKMTYVLIGVIGFIALFAVAGFLIFKYFNYIHVYFTPILEIVLIMVAITAYKVLTEEENVKYIRSTFSKFVSQDIVNELLSDPEKLKLGGEKKELTVFFSDVRGFTTISESLSPEDLVKLLNDYLSTMTDLIINFKGTIDKYMGDAIMAFWGAPIEEKDHAYYACLVSLVQLKELQIMQKRWEETGWPVVDIGIGLNSGYAVAGNMGSSHRMDYTVMGDTINLGSRLEGANKMYGTKIIISEFTYQKVADRVIARELDKIKVKGKHEPVTIYELVGIVNEADFDRYNLAKQNKAIA